MPLRKSKGNVYPWVSDFKYPWMAGFTDGEGWIGISKQVREERPSPAYRCVIAISNQKKKSLDVFREEYGGKVRKEKDCYRWHCPSGSFRYFLMTISPFLILKKQQAFLIWEYILVIEKKYGSKSLTDQDVELREKYYQAIKEINRNKFRRENALK